MGVSLALFLKEISGRTKPSALECNNWQLLLKHSPGYPLTRAAVPIPTIQSKHSFFTPQLLKEHAK